MKNKIKTLATTVLMTLILAIGIGVINQPATAFASGGSGSGGGGTPKVDTIQVSKCYCNSAGQMLILAASSDSTAHLYPYRPDGTYIGEVKNGGGSRYGGTVMPYQSYDPIYVTIISTSGGSVTVPTTPFQI